MKQAHRILVVDDNHTNIKIVERMLAGQYELLVARSGEEAVSLAPVFLPDLILLDIMMPGIDGYETCRRIRAMPLARRPKIVAVSARALPDERLRGYEAGADDYVTKPFMQEELLSKIRVYLQLKSSEEIDELKSNLMTLLAHETRTPVAVMLAGLEAIGNAPNLPPELLFLVDGVTDASRRLHHLIERVVMLSCLRSGTLDTSASTQNLCDLTQQAIDNAASAARERGVEITSELTGSVGIDVDARFHAVVVGALLDNAVRYSPQGGRVHVRVWADRSHALLKISDQGPGIDAELLPYIFNEFQVNDLDHHTRGSGLGLALAHAFTTAMGGVMSIQSTDQGTKVMVAQPLVADEALPEAA